MVETGISIGYETNLSILMYKKLTILYKCKVMLINHLSVRNKLDFV